MKKDIQVWLIENLGWDKICHFAVSGWLVLIVLHFGINIFVSALIVLSIGIIKELIDKFVRKGEFGYMDLIADISGVMISVVICLI